MMPIEPENIFAMAGLDIWLVARMDAPTKCITKESAAPTKYRIPTMIKPVAGPLTCGSAADGLGAAPIIAGGAPNELGALGVGPANSGYSESGFHSVVPSSSIRVCALARPSAIHWRNCSVLIGPYSLPSAPMILYMRRLCPENPQRVKKGARTALSARTGV